MTQQEIETDLDNQLCAIYDQFWPVTPIMNGLMDFVHENKEQAAKFIKERYFP